MIGRLRRVQRRVAVRGAVLCGCCVGITALGSHEVRGQVHPDGTTIALVTFGPGDIYWERFGHNGIWVRDPASGVDELYDYGRFSFRQESFLWRFVRGRMLYSAGRESGHVAIQRYIAADRSVWVQELSLTTEQTQALRDHLRWNALPENAEYRYHYYYDNCSTRIRDAIDAAVGGRLRTQTETVAGATLRFHTQRLTSSDPLFYTGLLIGLGSPIDRPASAWDEMFIPMSLREHMQAVQTVDDTGNDVSLVKVERLLYERRGASPPDGPPAWLIYYLGVGLGIAGLITVLAIKAPVSRMARLGFAVGGAVWSLTVGVAGVVLVFLWVGTDHTTSYWNENVLSVSPLALPMAVLLPLAVYGAARTTRPTVLLGIAVAASTLVGVVIQLLPWFNQVNGQLLALVLPPNLAILIGMVATLGYQSPPAPSAQ